MDINVYLDRINVKHSKECTLDYLTKLQKQHLLIIPYENFDIMDRKRIDLNISNFYEKIIVSKRGGFCYELSGIFDELLKKLGYKTHLISGNVKLGEDRWVGENCHVASIVCIDGQEYIADVGYGDGSQIPVSLSGELVPDVTGVYRIIPVNDNLYDLQRKQADESWGTLYRFSRQKKSLKDFEEMSTKIQTAEDSLFRQRRIAIIATKNGRIVLSNNTLKFTENGILTTRNFEEKDYYNILSKYFNLHLKKIL
jgi:N-hydroxyarylamine O-acetyltransferase